MKDRISEEMENILEQAEVDPWPEKAIEKINEVMTP